MRYLGELEIECEYCGGLFNRTIRNINRNKKHIRGRSHYAMGTLSRAQARSR